MPAAVGDDETAAGNRVQPPYVFERLGLALSPGILPQRANRSGGEWHLQRRDGVNEEHGNAGRRVAGACLFERAGQGLEFRQTGRMIDLFTVGSRIDEHQARHIVRVQAGENPDLGTAERRADEDVRRRDAGQPKCATQFGRYAAAVPGQWTGFRQSSAGAIVRHRSRKPAHAGLHLAPCFEWTTKSVFENDGGAAAAGHQHPNAPAIDADARKRLGSSW